MSFGLHGFLIYNFPTISVLPSGVIVTYVLLKDLIKNYRSLRLGQISQTGGLNKKNHCRKMLARLRIFGLISQAMKE